MNLLSVPALAVVHVATIAGAVIALWFLMEARRREYAGLDGIAGYAFAIGLVLAGALGVSTLLADNVLPHAAAGPSATVPVVVRAAVWSVILALFSIGFAHFIVQIRRHRHAAEFDSAITQSVLENLDEGYLRADRDGVIRYASESAARIFGVPRTQLIGMPADGFYRSPEDRESLLRRVDEAGGALQLADTRFRRQDGQVIHILFHARRIHDGSDCDGGLESFIRDMSEQRAADTAREASEERFRDFAEMASDWMWETDAEHRLSWISESFDERSGRRIDDLLGVRLWESFTEFSPMESRPDGLRDLMEAGLPVENMQYTVVTPDGRQHWRRLSARPRFDDKGKFLGYRGTTSDMTEVIEAETRFRNLIEASPDVIFVHRDGLIVYVNPALVKAFGGTSPEDFLGMDTVLLSHPEERDAIRERREQQQRGITVESRLPVHLVRLDGSDFHGESTIAAITWNGGPAVMVNLRDVTDRQQAEQRLRQSEERFRDFAELSSDWLHETDADCRLVWLSDSFDDKSPLPAEHVMGTRLWELSPGLPDGSDGAEVIRELLESHKPLKDFVFSLTDSEGHVYWRRFSLNPRFDDDGTFIGYRGSTTDITPEISTEKSFRGLIESMSDAIWIQRDGVILYANPATPRIFGAESTDEFIDMESRGLYHPDEHAVVMERRAALRRGERVGKMEYQRLRRRDGSEFAGEATAAIISWEGKPATMVMIRDISERVAADAARQESERQYRLLAEMLPEAFVIQCDGIIVYANANARARFGTGPDDDLTGNETILTVAPEFRDGMLERRQRVIATGLPDGPARCRHVHADGTTFESETVIGPLDWHGRAATINIISDISDRIAAEHAREESEQRFRDFAESTSDWFWEVGPDLRMSWLSTPEHPLSGVGTEELIGGYPWEMSLVDPDESPAWRDLQDRYLEPRKPFRDIVLDAYRPDGERYYVSLSGTPRFDETGTFLGYRGSTSDATQQMDLENRLRQSMKMEAIGQLTGGIAHDFNNLLAIISGNLELLAEGMDDDRPEQRLLTPARRATERGADLTRYMLAFSRQQPLEPRPTDINRLIAGMTDPLRRALGESISLETVIAAGGWLAQVDPAQTETAILNLALNARDAMPAGGRLTIETANTTLDADYASQFEDIRPGRYLMISVSDEGTGISPELMDRVFDPFVTTKDVGQGSGLGLSMVYGFVRQTGGHIRIYSEVGKGTTVRMYLPKATEGATEALIEARRESAPEGNGETVLLVEDDPDVLNLVDVLLTNLNYHVLKAPTPDRALELLGDPEGIDLLLTDVILPGGVTGVELARRIAEKTPEMPVIYMSGYTENSVIHQGVLDEGVMLLSKPFRKLELANLVRKALNNEGSRPNG